MQMPPLETERLLIRPFCLDDLPTIYRILDVELAEPGSEPDPGHAYSARERWLRWTVLGYDEFAALMQPPYGDRAVVLRESGELIGACGFAPVLLPFEQIPALGAALPAGIPARTTSEVGLYWAIAPAHQRRGYAAEAGRALIEYGLRALSLKRLVATTTYANAASIAVMRKIGMQVHRNPYSEPPWMQVVAVMESVVA